MSTHDRPELPFWMMPKAMQLACCTLCGDYVSGSGVLCDQCKTTNYTYQLTHDRRQRIRSMESGVGDPDAAEDTGAPE